MRKIIGRIISILVVVCLFIPTILPEHKVEAATHLRDVCNKIYDVGYREGAGAYSISSGDYKIIYNSDKDFLRFARSYNFSGGFEQLEFEIDVVSGEIGKVWDYVNGGLYQTYSATATISYSYNPNNTYSFNPDSLSTVSGNEAGWNELSNESLQRLMTNCNTLLYNKTGYKLGDVGFSYYSSSSSSNSSSSNGSTNNSNSSGSSSSLTATHTTIDTAEEIVFGQDYSHTWTKSNQNDGYLMKITLPKRGLITVSAQKPAGNKQLNFVLYDSDGQTAIFDNGTYYASTDASSKYVMHIGLNKGTYFLKVSHSYFLTSTNSVSTTITIDYEASEGYEIENNNSISSATTLVEGKKVIGYLGENDKISADDYYSLNVVAGNCYRIYIGDYANLEPSTALLDFIQPSGGSVKYENYPESTGTIENNYFYHIDSQIDSIGNFYEFIPDQTGNYVLKIYNYSGSIGELSYSVMYRNLSAPIAVPTSTEPGIGGFVERLYTVALGRPSDPAGKADWVNRVTNGGQTGADLAMGFLFSDEFMSKNMSNSQFLDVLYVTFFNRTADEGGKNNWLNAMAAGMSKQDVIRGFINSTEWANLCLTYGIASGGTGTPNITIPPSQSIIDFATRLYTTCLGRNADSKGLNDWATQLANRQISGSAAAHGFFFSEEFTIQNFSNDEYVTRLYRTFMGREPDPAGFADWTGRLANGASREDVFQGFAGSAEWAEICSNYGILK